MILRIMLTTSLHNEVGAILTDEDHVTYRCLHNEVDEAPRGDSRDHVSSINLNSEAGAALRDHDM